MCMHWWRRRGPAGGAGGGTADYAILCTDHSPYSQYCTAVLRATKSSRGGWGGRGVAKGTPQSLVFPPSPALPPALSLPLSLSHPLPLSLSLSPSLPPSLLQVPSLPPIHEPSLLPSLPPFLPPSLPPSLLGGYDASITHLHFPCSRLIYSRQRVTAFIDDPYMRTVWFGEGCGGRRVYVQPLLFHCLVAAA